MGSVLVMFCGRKIQMTKGSSDRVDTRWIKTKKGHKNLAQPKKKKEKKTRKQEYNQT